MTKVIGCIVMIVFFINNIYAQTDNAFFTNMDLYPKQVLELFGSNITNEENMQMNDFASGWKNNLFNDTEKNEIVKLSNVIFNRKAREYHFKLLTSMLYQLKKSNNSAETYPIVLNFINEFLNNKKNTLNGLSNFMLNIINVLNDNYLHNTSTLKWKFSNSNYIFNIQNNIFSITYSSGSLTCYSKNDSIIINETSGVYFPAEQKWIGNNGLVTWDKAKFKPSEVNAKLNRYQIDLYKVEYIADSVVFSYGKYFSHPVMGQLSDKVMNVENAESAIYPEFNSYNKRFYFKDLYENIDYDGGFSIKGAKIIGSGNEKEDAKIIVKKETKVLMEVKSKYFVFRPDRINGINTIVKINLNRDSIYHNDLSFFYFVKTKEVNLLHSDNYSSKSPYYNSYHKVDMDFDQLTWKIDQPWINLTMAKGAAIGKARFESQNYFNQTQFDKLQGMDAVHPLVALRKFSRMVKSNHFTVTSYADYVGRQLNEVRQELMVMAQNGFIYYNSQTDVVTIKKRLQDYLNSSVGHVDFDVVDFVSTTQAPHENAALDMETYDLYINGIHRIALSDSQNVIIYPTKEQIIMKENRSFQFDGKVEAGLFTFYGSNFFFNYNDFKINLQNVDSVILKVFAGELDNYGNPIPHIVKSVIQHLTGDVQIDQADNKSGRKQLHEFPRFESRENSYVYYQNKSIEGGVYPEESFYFEVYPFSIDSLDHLSKTSFTFNGKFQSSGILPPIEQQLKLQPDYTLGFQFNPGPGGIDVYGGKGKLFADITLNNNGLRGNGKLNYMTSFTTSKDFKFYPDSMNTQSDGFVMNEQMSGVQFPQVQDQKNYVHWATRDDQMFINLGDTPFRMFNNETNLNGNLILEPQGLIGEGTMKITSAEINSRLFRYHGKTIDGDTSQFLLKSLSKDGYTVITENNVKSHIDFIKQKGEFTANEDFTKVTFPENKYISFLNYFTWNMDDKTLEMGARITKNAMTGNNEKAHFEEKFAFEKEPVGPRYVSIHPKQDSLNFVAPSAIYDYQNNFINASDVKLIRVADAIIYPKDGKITVAESAQMRTIFDCMVVANYKDSLHTIHSANINIQGRQSFTGTGKYDYIDENEVVQTITMDKIMVDTDLHTIAQGTVLEPDSFSLSPNFAYQGKITLNSSLPLLSFTGAVQPRFVCSNLKPGWLKFNSEIEPKDIYIPIDENPVNINNNKLFAGIFMGSDSIHIYPAFISGRRNYNDSYIHTSSGFLHYDKDSMVYEIASKEKMQNRDTTGNYLYIQKTQCNEYGEGSLNLGVNLGQVKLSSYGSINYNVLSNEVSLDAILGIDFMMDPTAIQILANQIDSFPNLNPVELNHPVMIRSLYESLGKSVADVYLNDVSTGKPKAIPVEVQHTLNLTNLQLKWNHKTNSFQSSGKIGVGNILNSYVNRMVDGFIEITRKRSGDYMDIYLKLDDKNNYYFGYTRGVMQVFSTNTDFMNIIRKLTLKQRVQEVPKNETSYIFMVSSDTKIRNFLRSYNRHLKGESLNQQEQQIEEPSDQPENEPQPQNNQPNN